MAETRLEAEAKAIAFAMELQPIVSEIRAAGTISKLGIAKKLNLLGVRTQRGKTWTHVQVSKLLGRINLGTPD